VPLRRVGLLVVTVCLSAGLAAVAAGFFETIIGSKKGKTYHLYPEECGVARRIRPENVMRFTSAAQAEQAGRHLCKTCEKIRDKHLAESAQGGPKPDPKPSHKDNLRSTQKKPPPATLPAGPDPDVASIISHFARIERVLPGGTLELDVGEKARLLGVVLPADGQPFAKEATRFIKEQTHGRTVQLSLDSSADPLEHRDTLGRFAVYLTPQPDGRDLAGELLFQGYAWLDREARFDRQLEYLRREEEAWRDQRGMWKPLEGEAGNIEVVTGRFATQYHDPRCPHVALLTGKLTMTLNEAKSRRLAPCPLYKARRQAESAEGGAKHPPPAAPQPTSRPSPS
jgi:endonuclease YncB( thermonuclease family)